MSMGIGPLPGDAEAAIVALELRSPAAHYAAVEALCIAYHISIGPDDVSERTLRERLHEIAETLEPHVGDPADTLAPHISSLETTETDDEHGCKLDLGNGDDSPGRQAADR